MMSNSSSVGFAAVLRCLHDLGEGTSQARTAGADLPCLQRIPTMKGAYRSHPSKPVADCCRDQGSSIVVDHV